MKNSFMKICSMFLVLVLLANMLPLQVFAQQLNTGKTEPIVTAPVSADEEITADRVIAEIEQKRTEFSKEFLLSSGLHMVTVYPEAVHYDTAAGWEEIDNTLITKTDGTITNTAGVWEVSLPQQLSKEKSVTVQKDGHTLSFYMAGELTSSGDAVVMAASADRGTAAESLTASSMRVSTATTEMPDLADMRAAVKYEEAVPDKLRSRITYSNVFQSTNVVYDLDSNRVKESVVLESYRSTLRGYRYTLDVGTMVPVLQEDGQIFFYDAKQEDVVMVMPAPYMLDAAGEYNDDVQVQLAGSGSRYTLTYLLPKQWLAAEDRAWPVILDPTVFPSTDPINVQDRTVAENKIFLSNAEENACGYLEEGGIARTYLRFIQIPTLTSADVITNAFVQMDTTRGTTQSTPIHVHKVLEEWNADSLTWEDMPDFDIRIEDYAAVQDVQGYIWDITDIARGWYSGSNTGMMFKAGDEVENGGEDNYKEFASIEHSFETFRPTLCIYFRSNVGLESYWDYTTTSAGRAGTGYVNNYSGNLVWVREDIGFGGNRMPVSISHIYNANDAQYVMDYVGDFNNSNNTSGNAFGLGYGWRTNYNQVVRWWETNSPHGEHYIWEDADGTDHYFFPDEDGNYKDEDDLERTLTVERSGDAITGFAITDKTGNKRYFDASGRLTRMENNQQTKSSITITYVGESKQINYILDGANRKYQFEYGPVGGMLTKISYVGTGTEEISYVCFEYDGSKLCSVTDKDGGESTYTYCGDKLLETAQDVDGYTLTYAYNTLATNKPARITSVAATHNNQDGGTLHFEYDYNLTTVTDHDGNVQTMQFNNMGNTVCVQDDEGRAQYSQFAKNEPEDEINRANQLKLSSKLQNTVVNLLDDSSFENGTLWSASANTQGVSIVTSTAHYGNKSMQVTTTATASGVYKGAYTVAAGETITFSAYVKTGSATAFVCVFDYSSFHIGDYLQSNSEWTRLEVSYTNDTDGTKSICPHILTLGTGTFWVDNVQVEYTATASRYNLVENGAFLNGATGYSMSAQCSVANTTPPIPQLSSTACLVYGYPTEQKRISQSVAVSGVADDSFVFAAWAQGSAAPLWQKDHETNTREFAVQLQFHYTDGNTSNPFSAQFNADSDAWQYAAAAAVAEKAYSSVTITLVYDYNVNSVYFNGIQLFKEEFGTSYTYDEDTGNVISVVDLQKRETEYLYDELNQTDLLQVIQDEKVKMTYDYDEFHNVTYAQTEEGVEYYFYYDTYGNNKRVDAVSGQSIISTTATYSTDGNRLESITDALGKVTTYSYNADTNVLEWVQDPEDTPDTRTEYSYDSMYRTESVSTGIDAFSGLSAHYFYEEDLLTCIQTNSSIYSFTYGDFGLRTGVYAGNHTLAQYRYTNDGNYYLEELDYGNDDKVEYTYDEQGRVTLERFEDGDTVSYAYNSYGNLATVTDSATGITTTYYYDLIDRLVKTRQTDEDGNPVAIYAYTYDSDNNLSALTESIGSTSRTTNYAYDDDNRVTSVTNGTASEHYTYDGIGRNSQTVTKNGNATVLTESYTFTVPEGVQATTSTQVATNRLQAAGYDVTYTYTYDDNGNILSISDGTHTRTYEYDSANQLIRENLDDRGFTLTWQYDSAGNIVCRNLYPYMTGSLEDYMPADEKFYSYDEYTWGDLLTSYDGKPITYDEIGNPLSYGTWTYTWEHGKELATMSSNGITWTNTYDADGMRTQRSNGSTTYRYVYNGSSLSQMTVGNDILYFAYGANGTPMSMTYNGTTYYYVTNIQGDVIAILDATGTAVVTYTYDAWGDLLFTDGMMWETLGYINPLRYRGYVYDEETGFYYVSSRYYDPEIGRFINADVMLDTETVLGFNLFAYCGNNPIMYVDPTGYGRTYVIYYNNPGSGFYDQAMNSPYYNRKSKNVYMISVTSNQDFIDAWNSMSGTIDYVYLYLHGGKGVLYFKGESLSFSGKQSFSSLNSKKVKKGVYLFSCKGGAGSEGNNVAWMFAKLTNSKVYACTGSVSYSKIFGKYYARKAWDRGIIKTFYYQKRYIFWGANIAKSAAGQW